MENTEPKDGLKELPAYFIEQWNYLGKEEILEKLFDLMRESKAFWVVRQERAEPIIVPIIVGDDAHAYEQAKIICKALNSERENKDASR